MSLIDILSLLEIFVYLLAWLIFLALVRYAGTVFRVYIRKIHMHRIAKEFGLSYRWHLPTFLELCRWRKIELNCMKGFIAGHYVAVTDYYQIKPRYTFFALAGWTEIMADNVSLEYYSRFNPFSYLTPIIRVRRILREINRSNTLSTD